jgi:hypothetical protein
MLGLRNLLFYITECEINSSYVYKIASDTKTWYFFCASGINFTGHIIRLIEENKLNHILLHYKEESITLTHKIYDLLYTNFNKLWVDRKINNFMQFNTLLEEFMSTKAINLINKQDIINTSRRTFY